MNRLRKILMTTFWIFVTAVLVNVFVPAPKGTRAFGVTSCEAAAHTMKVTQADQATAEKLDRYLSKGQSVNLKVKGSKKASKKIVAALKKKIQKVNKQGVLFDYYSEKKSGNSYIYQISKDNAAYYQYSVKFIKKIWSIAKKNVETSVIYTEYNHDATLYPDETTRQKRQIYDFLVDYYIYGKSPVYSSEKAVGYDEATTTTHLYFYGMEYSELMTYAEKYVLESKSTEMSGSKQLTVYHIYSYEQFAEKYSVEEFLNHISIDTPTSSVFAILKATNFCDLSSAAQVSAISWSGYFYARKTRSAYGGYGMLYSIKKRVTGSGLKTKAKKNDMKDYIKANNDHWNATTIKNAYRNKVQGVCATFAKVERCVFDTLGISSETGTGYNHAWQIVKVKNADGKLMYVTFDYTLGFRTVRGNESYEALSENEKYRRIIRAYFSYHPKEKMPKKQNFDYATDIY